MRKIRLAVLIVSGIFLFQYCGYEEGPFISFRSKTNRLKGKWHGENVMYKYQKIEND